MDSGENPCQPLEVSAVEPHHDFDVLVFRLASTLTLGGASLPDTDVSRGRLEIATMDGETVSLDLGTSEPFAFDVGLPPGLYELRYAPNAQACTEVQPWLLPCTTVVLATDLNLTADTTLALDLPVSNRIPISGEITLDGATFPDTTAPRGALVFEGAAGTFRRELGTTGAALYELSLPAGTYEVRFEGEPEHCLGQSAAAVPCNNAVLDRAYVADTTVPADFNVASVRVSGQVTVNGAVMQNTSVQRGYLMFINELSRTISPDLGSIGAASYDMRLTAGTYSVDYKANAATCSVTSPVVPCHDGPLLADTPVTGDLTLDLDVPVVWVSGTVFANGLPLPDATGRRGRIRFATGAARATSAWLSASGSAIYTVALFPGTYDISFLGNPELCANGVPDIPCNAGIIRTGKMFSTTTIEDLNVPVAKVSGEVTVAGSPFPDEAVERGALIFAGPDSRYETPSFATTGSATFAATLIAGSYDVTYRPNSALCASATTPLPCRDGPLLRTGLQLTSVHSLALDLDVARVSGQLNLNGSIMPDAAVNRGKIVLRSAQGSFESEDLGATGAAEFSLVVYRGTYDVEFRANRQACTADAATAGPCFDVSLASSVAIPAPSGLVLDMEAVRMSGTMTKNGAPLSAGQPHGALELTVLETGARLELGFAADGTYAAWVPAGAFLMKHIEPTHTCAGDVLSCLSQNLSDVCAPVSEPPGMGGGGTSGCITEFPAYKPGELFAWDSSNNNAYARFYTVLASAAEPSGDRRFDMLFETGSMAWVGNYILTAEQLLLSSLQMLSPTPGTSTYTPPVPILVLPVCVGDTIPMPDNAYGVPYTIRAAAYEVLSLPIGSVGAIRLEYEINGTNYFSWIADGHGEVKLDMHWGGGMYEMQLWLTEHFVPE